MIISLNTTLEGQTIQPTDLALTFDVSSTGVQVTIQNAESKMQVTQFNMDIPTFTQMLKVLTDATQNP